MKRQKAIKKSKSNKIGVQIRFSACNLSVVEGFLGGF